MARSLKKGPFADAHLLKKVDAMNAAGQKQMCIRDRSNKDVKLRIRERAVDLGLPHNQQGWGKLDVARLVED